MGFILGVLALAGAGCVAPPSGGHATTMTPASLLERLSWDDFDSENLAEAIAVETNRARREVGLPPLRRNEKLDRAAELQASTAAMLGRSSHDNPFPRRGTVYERVVAAGIQPSRVGENVATSVVRLSPGPSGDPENWPWPTYAELGRRIVQQWLDSPPHRTAVLSPVFTHLGCAGALARGPMGGELVYSVQVFVAPRRERPAGAG